MQIFFRVEGNQKVGLGHVMRCFALAQAAARNQIEVSFICSSATAKFLRSRHDLMGKPIEIEDSLSSNDEINAIARIVSSMSGPNESISRSRALVLDGYAYNAEFQAKLKKRMRENSRQFIPLVYFDDLNSLEDFPQHQADIIVNGASSALSLGYEANASNSTCCLGPAYMSLRSEFNHLPLIPVQQRHSILICFGGADTANHTYELLVAFCKAKSDIPLRIVTGLAYQQHRALSDALACQKVTTKNGEQYDITMPVQCIHDAQEMAELMLHSRLAISAAGGSQFELLHCYTPSYLVVVADNQAPATTMAEQQGWASQIDWREKCVVGKNSLYIDLAQSAIEHYGNMSVLEEQQAAAFAQMEGLRTEHKSVGSENIIDAIAMLIQDKGR